MNDWQYITIGEITNNILGGGTPSTKIKDYWSGHIPWITSKWLNNNLYLHNGEKFISDKALNSSATHIVPQNNIIFATRVGVGKAAINKIDLAINQDLAGIIVDENRIKPEFLVYQLRTSMIQNEIDSYKRGATIKGITRDNLKALQIAVPPIDEQIKIVSILLLIHKAIEQQEKIIETVSELKKSLMQNIFTKKIIGETQRDTEIGLISESWKINTIGNISQVKGGKRLPKGEKLSLVKSNYPYIRVTDFEENTVNMDKLMYLTESQQKQISRYIIDKNNVYISIAGSIGIVGMIPEELDGANLTENAARLIVTDNSILPEYLMYWLNSDNVQRHIKSITVKNAQPKLALARIQKIPIAYPEIELQKEIVHVFKSLQRKLDITEGKKQNLIHLFSSMLQQLMTGTLRVDEIDIN